MTVTGRKRSRKRSQEANEGRDDNGLKYDVSRGQRCGFMTYDTSQSRAGKTFASMDWGRCY